MSIPGLEGMQSFEVGPSLSSQLGASLGGGIQSGTNMALENLLKNLQPQKNENKSLSPEAANKLSLEFEQAGFPKPIAKLMPFLTTGAQSKAGEFAVEDLIRNLDLNGENDGKSMSFSDSFSDVDESDFKEPLPPRGLKPNEKVAWRKDWEKQNFDRSKKYLEGVSEKAQTIPKEKVAIEQMRAALDSGDFNSWRNAISDVFGLDLGKTKSAQTVNAATKQFLISELAAITGRPNQFIEQQITKALISPQYQDEANQAILEGLELLSNLKNDEVDIALNLERSYASKGRNVPRDFQLKVKEKLADRTEKLVKGYENRLKELLTSKTADKDEIVMLSPDGERYAIPKNQVKAAQKSGYKLEK